MPLQNGGGVRRATGHLRRRRAGRRPLGSHRIRWCFVSSWTARWYGSPGRGGRSWAVWCGPGVACPKRRCPGVGAGRAGVRAVPRLPSRAAGLCGRTAAVRP